MPCDVGYLRLRCGDSVVSSKKSVVVATQMMTMNGLLKYLCALVNIQMEARQSYGEDCDCSLCAGGTKFIHLPPEFIAALGKEGTLVWVVMLFDKQKIENIFCLQFAVYF
jgi:hypothetical protein